MKYIYWVTFVISLNSITTESTIRFDNRDEAVNFFDSINFTYPNAARIDSLIIK